MVTRVQKNLHLAKIKSAYTLVKGRARSHFSIRSCHIQIGKKMNSRSAAERLRKFEGATSYMYRCSGGEVTVGVGHAIFDEAHAAQLPWTDAPASTLIATDFARVAATDKGFVATRYENLTQCRLSEGAVDTLLLSDIDAFEKILTASLPTWQSYPEPVQQALFDMAYNLGVGGLLKFHKLLAACASGDWETAATECRRGGIGDSRNQETAALFRQAAGA
jgi:GH24 family phage-related lysozyme (muramidase)